MYAQTETTRSPAPPGSVLIVGVGALGCPAAAVAVRAGVERVTLVDPDVVDLSNLQRQVLFREDDVGRPKVEAATAALAAEGSRTRIDGYRARVTDDDAAAWIGTHDFVIDACDDPATKLLVSETCVRLGRPHCYGGVVRTGGQTMTVVPGLSACLACVFGPGTEVGEGGACSEMGILAPVAGVIGSLQGLAAVRWLSAGAIDGAGRMMIYDAYARRWHRVGFARDPDCPVCRTAQHQESRRLETCHS